MQQQNGKATISVRIGQPAPTHPTLPYDSNLKNAHDLSMKSRRTKTFSK